MAKREQNIDRIIREGFQSGAPKAPAGLWERLSEDLDQHQLDQKLREAYQDEAPKAPEALWSNIDRQLNIDRVWLGIKKALDRQLLLRWSAVAAVLMLLALWLWPNFNAQDPTLRLSPPQSTVPADKEPDIAKPEQRPEFMQNASSQNESSEEESSALNQEQQADPANLKTGSDAPPAKVNSLITSISDRLPLALPVLEDTNHLAQFRFLPMPTLRAWQRFRWEDEQGPFLDFHPHYDKIPSKRSESKPWQFGLRLMYERVQIDNNIHRQSLDPNSLVAEDQRAVLNYELFTRWSISDRQRLELSYAFNEGLSQQYARYGEGKLLQEELTLSFNRFAMLYAYQIPLKKSPGASRLEIAGGPFAAFLSKANLNSPLGRADLSAEYGNNYGLQFRIGQEVSAADLVLSYGLQGRFGLTNLYRGTANIPAIFDHTRSTNLGLYLGVGYKF